MRRQDDKLKFIGTDSWILRRIILATTVLVGCTPTLAQTTRPTSLSLTSMPAPMVRKIVVSIPDRKLALVENGRVVKTYRVAVGAPASPSPAGQFTIVDRVLNPTYYKPGVVIESGPSNPLGTRWIGLSAKGFGIHGTNKPHSIGHNTSHGCIRLRNEDAEDLFERVRPGDSVELVNERNDEIAALFDGPEPPPAQAQNVVLVAQASGHVSGPVGQE